MQKKTLVLAGSVMYIMDVRFSKNSLGKLFKIDILIKHLPGEWHLVIIRNRYIVIYQLAVWSLISVKVGKQGR